MPASEHRQSRCSAIESQLKQSFDGLHQFLVKWRFRPAGPKPLILRPEIDRGSKFHLLLGDVHAAACGIKIEGAEALEKYALWHIFSGGRAGRPRAAMPDGPFDASLGFVDSLRLLKQSFVEGITMTVPGLLRPGTAIFYTPRAVPLRGSAGLGRPDKKFPPPACLFRRGVRGKPLLMLVRTACASLARAASFKAQRLSAQRGFRPAADKRFPRFVFSSRYFPQASMAALR